MKRIHLLLFAFSLLYLTCFPQKVTVDLSGSTAIVQLLKDMKAGTSQLIIEERLDSVLKTRPYQFMFQHYNRSWRPNTLPKDVFKRMILSVKWPAVYKIGENTITDYMKNLWLAFYIKLPSYEQKLQQLSNPKFIVYIQEGVKNAQRWLPSNMNVPEFYLAVMPVGRSEAFVFNGSQGYDLLQLPTDINGQLKISELVSSIAHESHHLGLDIPSPSNLQYTDSLLFQYLTIFIPEGSATKFIDNFPGGYAPIVNKKKGYIMDKETDSLWQYYTRSENDFFAIMLQQFEDIYKGTIKRDSFNKLLNTYWLKESTKPPLYFWGSELMGVIYHGLGKKGVFAVMNDPRKLFYQYNKALEANSSLRKCFQFIPDKFVKISLSIGLHTMSDG